MTRDIPPAERRRPSAEIISPPRATWWAYAALLTTAANLTGAIPGGAVTGMTLGFAATAAFARESIHRPRR